MGIIFFIFAAVRDDRMRGGRNKFGSMYKRDRAERMKNQRNNERYSILGDHMVSSSTPSAADIGVFVPPSTVENLYNSYKTCMGLKSSYENHVQSPTLSSSTHSPPHRPPVNLETSPILSSPFSSSSNGLHSTAAYTPNCDINLTALLTNGVDDPLSRSHPSAFYPLESFRIVKPEPFEYDPFSSFSSLSGDYSLSPYGSSIADQTLGTVGMGSFPTGFDVNSSNAGTLPICPLPTSQSFHNHLNLMRTTNHGSAFKANAAPSLTAAVNKSDSTSPNYQSKPNEFLMNLTRELFTYEDSWRRGFVDQVQQFTGDNFTVICHAVDTELHREVTWAKNNAYFSMLQVKFENRRFF